MELPEELKSDLHRTLLGPLSLADELFGALLPGCVFSLILTLKGIPAVTKAFSYPYLGYKTKIGCGLLVSYVFGKVALSLVTMVEEFQMKRKNSAKGKPLANVAAPLKSFLGGLVTGPVLSGKSRNFEYFFGFRMQTHSCLSMGVLLGAAAVLPGDGNLRLVEALAGTVLFLRGFMAARESENMMAGMVGMAVGESLGKMSVAQLLPWIEAVSRIAANHPAVVSALQNAVAQKPTETASPDPVVGKPAEGAAKAVGVSKAS
jgi:hypothetical protein